MNHLCLHRWPTLGIWVLAGGLLAPAPAAAIEFRAGQHVVVSAQETVTDDLYVTGETVTIEGRIEGDLITSGREIRISGEVTGDLMAAGQAIDIDGAIGDDIRIAGMALRIGPAAAIGDDVVSAGFSLETSEGSTTGGSLLFSGFQALLAGDIRESLTGAMAALEIRGGIGGDSEVEVDGDPNMPPFVQYIPSPIPLPVVAGGLTITDSARVDGNLEYTSSQEARGDGAGSSTLKRIEPAVADREAAAVARKPSWPGKLFKLLGLIVLGLLLTWAVPGWLDKRSGDIRSKLLPVAGIGLLGVAALPVGIVLVFLVLLVVAILFGVLKLGSLAALVMILGLATLGLVLLLFWLTAAYLAPLLVGLTTGRWLLGRLTGAGAAGAAAGLVWPLLAGLVLLALLRFVPFLGFLVAVAVLFLGWGAILMWLWTRWRAAAAT